MSGDDENPDDSALEGEAELVGDDDVRDAGAGMTMQLDAVVDSLVDVALPPGVVHGMSRPPPLPPAKISKGMWIVGVLIVLTMAGLGIGAGAYMLRGGGDTPTATAPAPAPAAPPAPEAAEPGEDDAPSGVVQLDEIVFDDTAEETPEPPPE